MIIILTCGFKISECLDVLLGSLHLRCWVGGFPFPKRTLDNWIKGILLLRRLHHHVLQLTYSVSFPTGCKVPSSKVNACYCPNSQLQAELSHELQIRQKPDLEQRGCPLYRGPPRAWPGWHTGVCVRHSDWRTAGCT